MPRPSGPGMAAGTLGSCAHRRATRCEKGLKRKLCRAEQPGTGTSLPTGQGVPTLCGPGGSSASLDRWRARVDQHTDWRRPLAGTADGPHESALRQSQGPVGRTAGSSGHDLGIRLSSRAGAADPTEVLWALGGWTWVPVDLWGPETRTQAPPGWASGGTRPRSGAKNRSTGDPQASGVAHRLRTRLQTAPKRLRASSPPGSRGRPESPTEKIVHLGAAPYKRVPTWDVLLGPGPPLTPLERSQDSCPRPANLSLGSLQSQGSQRPSATGDPSRNLTSKVPLVSSPVELARSLTFAFPSCSLNRAQRT
ncbi:hypothetical protein JEQ12_017694 [Ovis aries]|uniref:Uncharacterized protein n=1 Tax=Ovis aries TaxID=9940 RepID=A0A836A4H9_SHEEP|nr:hypothetical protein JEQ12_017694 [Ovis aries]